MVIGNGLLAKIFLSFNENKKVLIFASGVSNSTETDRLEYKREFDLLKDMISNYPTYQLVYFSTLSIEDESVNDRPYIKHKLQLEKYIKNKCSKYLICRVSNVVGANGNTHTIMNYLVDAVKLQKPIDIWKNAERNIIDVDDVYYIVKKILDRNIVNKTVSIATSKSVGVVEIVNQIELYLDKKANANYIDKGEKLIIDTSDITKELLMIGQKKGTGEGYITSLLKKYY